MDKKVICLITNWYPTPQNPFQGVFFKEQAIALREHFDFLVIHYDFTNNNKKVNQIRFLKEEENIKEYKLELSIPTKMKRIRKKLFPGTYDAEEDFEKHFLKTFKNNFREYFDVLYCVSCQKEARYLKILGNFYQKPYIVSEHGPVPWLGTIVSDLNKRAIEEADLLLAISFDKLRQIMMQDIKLPQYVYVGNMVDETQFVYKESGNVIKTFVMVGAHVFYKNYDMLIRIMSRLKQITSIPFRIMIVGYNSNKEYSRDVEQLERKIKESDLYNYVEMIPSVAHSKMHEVFVRADAFVMTSVQEGMPVSSIEAGCCGLPIFSTRCGGVEDFVTEQIGRIYGILDVEGFAQGLRDYLEGHIEFDAMKIRQQVVEQFGKEAFVNKLTSAFNSVIESKLIDMS